MRTLGLVVVALLTAGPAWAGGWYLVHPTIGFGGRVSYRDAKDSWAYDTARECQEALGRQWFSLAAQVKNLQPSGLPGNFLEDYERTLEHARCIASG